MGIAMTVSQRTQPLYDTGTSTEDLLEDRLRVLAWRKVQVGGSQFVERGQAGIAVLDCAGIVENVFTDGFNEGAGGRDGSFWVCGSALQGLLPTLVDTFGINRLRGFREWPIQRGSETSLEQVQKWGELRSQIRPPLGIRS